ncbi:eCIS core domain-containing protein [Mesobacterium pallidum]|uniref:eCIS core domain-containing protein n=1 Tax=Mesobacterium pallidum TaxID=2872037 RepID=UPI001EE3251A|nr:DUF4157 domain-containing protein [Mesobacterium pallidum]
MKRRIRRKLKPRNPVVRRQPQAGKVAPERDGAPMIGGAHDPAEKAADTLTAQALSGGPAPGQAPAAGNAVPVRRDAPAPRIAPGAAAAPAPAGASRALDSLGGGRPLSLVERADFEPRFGRDFSGVRLHEGPAAIRATQALDARAFTTGQDIAFAPGARDRLTMAHELAHVAQGDTGVRRKIHTDITKGDTSNIGYKLKKDYGVTGFKRSGQDWTIDKADRSGPINKEIASAMLASSITFNVKGSHLHRAEASLRDHLAARRAAIEAARTVRFEFDAEDETYLQTTLKFVNDEAWNRVRAGIAKIPDFDKKPFKDRVAIIKSGRLHFIKQVMQEEAGKPKFDAAMKEIINKSKAWEKTKTGLRPYTAACFITTATVMYGAGGKLQEKHVDPGIFTDVRKNPAWHEWVPGDWGYVKNTDPKPALGLEGENIIYMGKDKFWAHFDPGKRFHSLNDLASMVAGWNADDTFILETRRRYPLAGLK